MQLQTGISDRCVYLRMFQNKTLPFCDEAQECYSVDLIRWTSIWSRYRGAYSRTQVSRRLELCICKLNHYFLTLQISFNGYNHKMPIFMDKMITHLLSYTKPDENRFDCLLTGLKQRFKSFSATSPHQQADGHCAALVYDRFWSNEEKLAAVNGALHYFWKCLLCLKPMIVVCRNNSGNQNLCSVLRLITKVTWF